MIHCLVVDDEPLARETIINYINRLPELKLVAECENAIEAIAVLRQQKTDLVFLDIEMPEINGIQFLQTLKTIPGIIFTTAYRNYAADAFDLDVIDFLLKPISFERFLRGVDKYYERKQVKVVAEKKEITAKTINVRADRKTYKLELDKIWYFESLKDYVKIIGEDGTVITHETLSSFEEQLNQQGFLRIHRSFLVAAAKIDSFDAETVYLKNKELPISRTYKQNVLNQLEK